MGPNDFFLQQPDKSEHHYAFAHLALREIAFGNPVRIFNILASDRRTEFFDDVLNDLDGLVPPDTGKRNFTGADIRVAGFGIDGRPCALLEMPPTTNPTEAYFIAIVGRLPMDELMSHLHSETAEPLIDYYTLERPFEITPDCPSVFCAWTPDDTHHNFGAGPEPDLRQFAAFLEQRVQTGNS